MEVDTTQETQGDESQLNSAPVEGASNAVAQTSPEVEAMTLNELNTLLGKSFKDKASAMDSLKQLNSYVGKKKEDIIKELSGGNENITKEIKQIKENLFYSKRPELEEYRPLISKLGENPEEVVGTQEFKTIFEKAKGYDETVKLKTVLESNPRLTSSRDHMTKAREASQAGNKAQAENFALKAVLDSLQK